MRKFYVVLMLTVIAVSGFGLKKNTIKLPEPYSNPTLNASDDVTEFYAIGWSKDGKFAYLTYDGYDDGMGNKTDFYFAIQDMVWDDIVYTNVYRAEFVVSDAEQLWKERPEIQQKCKEYGIVADEVEYAVFPFEKNGIEYTCELMYDFVSDEMFSLSEYQVEIWKNYNQYKIIADGVSTYAAEIHAECAFFSPYENRMAVMIREYQYGFEGPPFSVEPVIFGSHMTSGFSAGGY